MWISPWIRSLYLVLYLDVLEILRTQVGALSTHGYRQTCCTQFQFDRDTAGHEDRRGAIDDDCDLDQAEDVGATESWWMRVAVD